MTRAKEVVVLVLGLVACCFVSVGGTVSLFAVLDPPAYAVLAAAGLWLLTGLYSWFAWDELREHWWDRT